MAANPIRTPRGAKARAEEVTRRLAEVYPAACALEHENPYQLLIATILSAQTTDRAVNSISRQLFARYPTPADLAVADPTAVEAIIKPTGFYHAKARSIMGCAQHLSERYGGEVPPQMEELVTLPGVGRKTANVVLGVAFGIPGLPVDTHVKRLSNRLRLVAVEDPEKIEQILCRLVPSSEWTGLSLRLIQHGRRVCLARRPLCSECILANICPSAFIL